MKEERSNPGNAVTANRRFLGIIVSALMSAFASGGAALAVSCCAGPALFVALGLGFSGAAIFERLAPYRLQLSILSVGLLAFSFWSLYLRKPSECEMNCSPRTLRTSKMMFWFSVFLVAVALIVPTFLDSIMLRK